jgi:hypothetical protein
MKTRTILFCASCIVCAIVLTSCNREDAPDCFQAAGEYTTVQRNLEVFTSIELNDYIQYELIDTTYSGVIIQAPGNLIPDIETKVEDGVLVVHNRNTCNFVRSFKNRITVRICAPEFRDIQNYATGDVVALNTIDGSVFSMDNRSAAGVQRLTLDVDTVRISSHTGVSDAIVRGRCNEAYLFNQGVGSLDARSLQANNAFVNNSSLNDVYVYSLNYLYAYIQFSGNIYYRGNPIDVDVLEEGEGRCLPL